MNSKNTLLVCTDSSDESDSSDSDLGFYDGPLRCCSQMEVLRDVDIFKNAGNISTL